MSYTVLARRYRSGTFDEVIGQDHVARTLKRAIESGRIAHAYLFCGTRGVGKTSMARILAKALNCERFDAATATPCGKCNSCTAIARGEDIDVIEIDAASNRGIENVRDLISNAQFRPARSRFKVYIIDEVHGLTKDAFNALLKVLEEPPEHVKFILATTEAEKVLPTILSRCQRYDFRNIPTREIAGHLKAVTKQEKIQADDDALLLVAKAGAGSMRDALSLLDRLLSVGEKNLTAEMIEQLLGMPRSQLIFDLVQAVGEGDTKSALGRADSIINGGFSVDALVAALVDHLRNLLILKTCGADSELVEVPGLALADLEAQAGRFDAVALSQDIAILEELRRHIRQSQAGRALLDATLVRLALSDQFASIGDLLSRLDGNGVPPSGARPTAPSRPAGSGVAPKLPVKSPAQQPTPAAQKKKTGEVAEPRPAGTAQRDTGVSPVRTAPADQGAWSSDPPRTGGTPVSQGSVAAPAAPTSGPPAVPAVNLLDDLDLGDDDDLPRPGKVWEGPSLKDLMASSPAPGAAARPAAPPRAAEPAAAAPESAPSSNVERVSPEDLPGIWQALLKLLAEHGPGLHSLLSHGRLVSIADGRATIRYGPQHETFVKMLDRNGKKEIVRDAITRVLNQSLGVTFEVDPEPAADPAPRPEPGGPAPATAPRSAAPAPRAAAAAPEPPPPPVPAVPTIKVTPELIESIRTAEPLVRKLMDDLGATIIKVEAE